MFLIIVNQIVKMLLLLLLGIFCYRKKLIDQTGSKMLANLLLMIVNPMLAVLSLQVRLQPTAGPWTSAFLSGRISDAHCRLHSLHRPDSYERKSRLRNRPLFRHVFQLRIYRNPTGSEYFRR